MDSKSFNHISKGGDFDKKSPHKEKQTFEQLAQEAQNLCFKDTHSELLKMSETSKLDAVLQSIENFVQFYGKDVSTSQLRNVYDNVIKTNSVNTLKLIRPQLAYMAGRKQDREKKEEENNKKTFLAFLDFLIKSVDSESQRKEFKTFFESVVAYHKFYSNKK